MLSWFQQLDRAADTTAVVAIARDYFATWSPGELARLPVTCRPGHVRAPSDLEAMHECAVDAFRATRAGGEDLKALQLMTSFLVHANLRIVQLQAAGDEEESPAAAPDERAPKTRDR